MITQKSKKIEKAYKEILECILKYKDIIRYDYEDLSFIMEKHLFEIKLREEFGLDIEKESVDSLNYINIDSYRSIGWWGEKYHRTISWSDNGKQPKDELLFSVDFPTGAYIFGEDRPEEFFQKFFQELKSYKPKYIDTMNKNLYFSMDNAKDLFNNFSKIFNKYNEKNKKDSKKRRIKELKKKIEELQNNE